MSSCISILGSTGSIGRQTLDVVDKLGLRVAALTANRDVDRLEAQCRKYRPKLAAMMDEAAYKELKARLSDMNITVVLGLEGLITAASLPEADTVVTAVSGMVGLKPTLAAIREGKRIALANKETLVCAGELVMGQAKKYGAKIIPVDSEHSAIFQCLMGNRGKTQIKRLILTCSGGPFYGLSRAELAEKKKADALRHPNWKMGAKITIDCATLMNKGLEIIEAMRLYDLPLEKVTAVVHRQSIVHSMVEFTDGAVMAQLGAPDMRIPISLADLLSCPPLTFAEIDEGNFDCFRLAKEAAKRGGTVCAAMNAANEEAVALYLQDAIGFYDISELVSRAMELPSVENPKLRDILNADKAARELVRSRFSR